MNDYLAIDSGGYLCANNCSVAECFSEKSGWCLIEQVHQSVKCKALIHFYDRILYYIKTFLMKKNSRPCCMTTMNE